MNRMTVVFGAGLVALSAALSGCATSTAGDTYSRGEVGQVNQVQMGTVVGVRQVKIEGTKSGVGTTAGVIAGGAAGSQIGGGTTENIIGGVAGAVVGGLIGAAAEEGLTRDTGYEYVVRLDDGRTVTIVQAGDVAIAPGTRVQVIFGERARVVPAP
jgi:outer membrane lipoprotein SlyB